MASAGPRQRGGASSTLRREGGYTIGSWRFTGGGVTPGHSQTPHPGPPTQGGREEKRSPLPLRRGLGGVGMRRGCHHHHLLSLSHTIWDRRSRTSPPWGSMMSSESPPAKKPRPRVRASSSDDRARPSPGLRLFDGCLIAAFLALTFLLGVFPLKDTDFWWHLRTGDLIRQTGQVPKIDLYTFTVPDASLDRPPLGLPGRAELGIRPRRGRRAEPGQVRRSPARPSSCWSRRGGASGPSG